MNCRVTPAAHGPQKPPKQPMDPSQFTHPNLRKDEPEIYDFMTGGLHPSTLK